MPTQQTPRPTAEYVIRVRNASRVLVGEVDAYDSFGAILRFNNVSTWTLALAADHPMAGFLATKGYGVQVLRNVRDTSGALITAASGVLLSGPVRSDHRRKSGNLLEVAGVSDDCWLAARDAWPVTNLPYSGVVLADSPLRYYRLNESSAGSVADSSGNAQNGTWSGTTTAGTFQQSPAVDDDADHSITFNGTDDHISVPTTGLTTGNGAFSLECWFTVSAYPGATALLLVKGTNAMNQDVQLHMTTAGDVELSVQNVVNVLAGSAVSLDDWHHLVGTYDGTTLRTYLDGVAGATNAPAALNVVLGTVQIASHTSGAANFFGGGLDEVAIYNTALSATRVAAHYATGRTRFAASAYDTQTGAGETVLRHYVDVNAGPSAITPRQVSGLTLAADGGAGSSVIGNARFDKLLDADGTSGLLQQLAQAAGGLGFRVVQSGSNLQFQVYTPTDRTASVIFSDELGNLADFDWSVTAPDFDNGGNVVVVGGGGEGTARVFIIDGDAQSVTAWGRVEWFVDARDTSDLATLTQRGADALAQTQEQTTFSAVLAPQEGIVYGVDFGLGDNCTFVIDGVSYADILREIDIELSRDGAETVTPGVGSPGSAIIQSFLGQFARDARRIASRVARLERRQ